MPWDGTELRVGAVAGADGGVTGRRLGAGHGRPAESVVAPRWRNDESLYAISDASGWWNLYEAAAVAGATPRPLHPAEEEFAGPLWELGGRPFELLSDGRLAVLHGLGELQLAALDPVTGALADIHLPGYRTGAHRTRRLRHHDRQRGGRPGRPVGGAAGRSRRRPARPAPASRSVGAVGLAGPTRPTCRTRARPSCRAGRTDG